MLTAAEKWAKLTELQNMPNTFSANIKAVDLLRLVDGDLSHIGDALIEGKEVTCNRNVPQRWMFTEDAVDYEIKKPVRMINGIECPAPETKPLTSRQRYFIPSLGHHVKYHEITWVDAEENRNHLQAGKVFTSVADATTVSDALLSILGGQNNAK